MRILLVVTASLLCSAAFAADSAQDEAFKTAWQAYSEAVESGRPSRMIKTAQAVVEIAETIFPESDARLALILQNYGVALRRGKKKDEARSVLERSLRLMENIHGKESIELVPVISDLADACSSFRNNDQQQGHYKRAMKIVGQQHGKDSIEYADIAFRAATNIFSFSRSLAGRKYLVDAQKIYQAQLGADDQRVGLASFFLGKMAYAERDNRRATTYLDDALMSFVGESDEVRQYRQSTHALLVQVYEERGRSDLATEHCVAIGRENQLLTDQDYQPLFRQVPKYPKAMSTRGIEGFVDVEFTVNENGFTENARVIKAVTSKPSGTKKAMASDDEDKSFGAAALQAVKKFRYAPRFENGTAVPVERVKTRITFKLNK